ncbi:MAG: hypothetical protein DME76_09745 [Verrucomicrobia bacterium]|nr:MAG: hypothetical protein DME76_09745 [Verrucomicrobiota bacterium]
MLRGITRSGERLGFPTQKPLALLERIVAVSSDENDIVLDAFAVVEQRSSPRRN